MKKIFRTTLTTAIIAAVGVNMYHTYDSYRNVNMSEAEFLFKENVEALSSIELDDEDIDEATRLRRQRCFDDNGIWGSSIRCMGNMQVTFVTGTGNYSVEGTVAGTGAKITIPRNYKTKVGK